MTRQASAQHYHDALLECGATPAEARKEVDKYLRDAAALDRRECPDCGEPIQRKLDPRQVGAGCADDQAWFNYICRKCNFFCDRAE